MDFGIKRIPTGVEGFDKLISGGFPENFVILLAGTPGTGKSIFSLEYIYNGAAMFNEKGIYITLEQTLDDLKRQAILFGWDFDELEKKGMVLMESVDELGIDELIQKTGASVEKLKPARLVIDSLSGMLALLSARAELISRVKGHYLTNSEISAPYSRDRESSRKIIWDIFKKLKNLNCTTIIPSEINVGSDLLSTDGVSEFACDGIVVLKKVSMGREEVRTISVEKMRSTPIDGGTHDFEFKKDGVFVE